MEYLDFVLMIDRGRDRGYTLRLLESPAGEASGSLGLETSAPQLRGLLRALKSGDAVGDLSDPGSGRSASPEQSLSSAAQELGRTLFESLVETPGVYACYHTSLLRAREQGKGLRLRLRCQPPELSALPWELLFDPGIKRDHLCLSRETPLVRHLDLEVPNRAPDAAAPHSHRGHGGFCRCRTSQ